MSQPPNPLSYRTPTSSPPPRWPGTAAQFFIGVGGGILFSVVYYIVLSTSNAFDQLGLGAVTIKTIAGITLICLPRWRPLGIGLIVSIPVAILIVVGLCFGVVVMN